MEARPFPSRDMPRISSCLIGALLGLAWARVEAVDLRLPPVSGEISGVLAKFVLPGAPELRWKIAAKPAADGGRDYTLTTDSIGSRMRATAHASAVGNGTWTIEEGELDVGSWLAIVAPEFAPSLVGMTATGKFTATGGGELREGQPSGKVRIEWKDGTLAHAEQGWRLEGISIVGEFSFEAEGPHWASVGPLQATVRTITATRFGARNFSLMATLDDKLVADVLGARLEIAGGEVTVEPNRLPLSPFAADVKLKISRVGLQDIVALVPAGLKDARGRVDGTVRLQWNEADGLQLGTGELAVNSEEPVTVTLAPTPGLLSQNLPERFGFIPESAGRISRWLSIPNPAFEELKGIELGQTDLVVQSLKVRVTPDGDERGRSASVEVTARSSKKGAVDEISFEVNLSGPLAAILKIGMDDRAKLNLH